MGFWIFMLVCDLLIPFTMIYFGRRFRSNPPDRINGIYGYRTKRSMKNMDTWKFAHDYCGKLWQKAGWIMLAVSVILLLLCCGKEILTVSKLGLILCMFQCVVLVVTIIPVERALKRNFDEYGRRR